ncbi:MAG: PAS domain-containing protein [bacterium]|nr:PAS domain-containing protein [bacterium]
MKKILCVAFLFGLLLSTLSNVSAEFTQTEFFDMYEEFGSIVLIIDPENGNIIYANQAAVLFYGYSQEILLSKKISDINTLSPNQIQMEMDQALLEQRNFFRFQHITASGIIKFVEVYSYPIEIEGQMVLFSIIHDVTEAIHLQELNKTLLYLVGFIVLLGLAGSGSLLWIQYIRTKELTSKNSEIQTFNALRQTFIDEQIELVYLKDSSLRYVFVNHAVEKFYRLSKEEIIGKTDEEIDKHEYFTKRKQETDQAVLSTKQRKIAEVVYNNRVFATTKFPIKLADGSIGVGAVIREITEETNMRSSEQKTLARIQIVIELLTKSFDSQEAQYQYVIDELIHLVECEHTMIHVFNESTGQFNLITTSFHMGNEVGNNKLSPFDFNSPTGKYAHVITSKQPFINNSVIQSSMMPTNHVSIRQLAMIPIVVEGIIQAIVTVINKPGGFSEFDVYHVSMLMSATLSVKVKKDISGRLNYERQKYLQTLLSIGDGVVVVNRLGVIEVLNPVAEALTGWRQNDAIGVHYERVLKLYNEQHVVVSHPIQEVLETKKNVELIDITLLKSRKDEWFFIEDSAAPLFDETKNLIGVVMVFRDVTQLITQRKAMEYSSMHDSLTKLFNRRYLEEAIQESYPISEYPITFLFCDVNGLKFTNDAFGHRNGDQLLLRAVDVLIQCAPQNAIVTRWGGDEFIVLCKKTDEDAAYHLKHQIKDLFASIDVNGLKGSISIGYQTSYLPTDSLEQVMNEAESFMYREKTMERETYKNHSVDTIMSKLHALCPSEASHSEQVSRLALLFGQFLQLDVIDIERLRTSGFYHDIGKIILPLDVLLKNDTLDGKEWKAIKDHPLVSYRILNGAGNTADIADIVLSHHENYDGSGYPKGLKGNQVLKLSRILRVIEAYEAMTSPRPYHRPLSKQEATEELKRGSGTQFDPSIVNDFLSFISTR